MSDKIITVTVRDKIARAEGRARVVCGNSDYAVRFDFDAEWAAYAVKTARFVGEDGSYTDVQFEGSDCAVPILRSTRTLLVGVFAGDLRTTTAALIHAVPCITDPDGTPADPTPDVYAQLMERFNAMEAPAAILYEKQELTDEQKAQARANINADRFEVEIYRDRGTPYSNKTAKEIYDAYASGKNVEITAGGTLAVLTECLSFYGDGKYRISCYVPQITEADSPSGFGPRMLYLEGASGAARGPWAGGLCSVTSTGKLDPITGIVTADKLDSPVNSTDLITYGAFATAVPRGQQMGITAAKVGQTIKVKTVDADGKPTAWEAVDMAGGEQWTKICDITLTDDDPNVSKLEISALPDGTPLEGRGFTEIIFAGTEKIAEAAGYSYSTFLVNDKSIIVGQNFAVNTTNESGFRGKFSFIGGGYASADWAYSSYASPHVIGGGIIINPHYYGTDKPNIADKYTDSEIKKIAVTSPVATSGATDNFKSGRLVVFGR